MQRFALLLILALSRSNRGSLAEPTNTNNLRTSRPNYTASHQRRELSAQDWWYSLLNHLHVPCPPGSSDDHPLGHCAHESHHPPHHHSSHSTSHHSSSHSSGGSGGSNGGSSSSSSGGKSSGSSSSSSSSNNNSKNSGSSTNSGWDDDGWADDGWADDGWSQNQLDNGAAGASVEGVSAANVGAFLIGALVAAMVGAAFIAFRTTRDKEEAEAEEAEKEKSKHPLKGALRNRLKAFPFRRKKKGMLDDEIDEEGGGFVEISNVQRGDNMSVRSGRSARSYNAPVISGFDDEDTDSDED